MVFALGGLTLLSEFRKNGRQVANLMTGEGAGMTKKGGNEYIYNQPESVLIPVLAERL